MNMKTVIPLALAIVLGLVAAIMVRNTMAHRSSPIAFNANSVLVVVARQDVDPGRALAKEDLTTARVPAEVAPTHVFSDPNQLVGRVTLVSLSKGQPITETLLAEAGSGAGLQALIPPGMRAYTLEVNEFSGVAGMLEPGCHVDLVSAINDPKTHETMARTILQNIKVGAIGRSVVTQHPVEGQPAPAPSNNITLVVTPGQAQIIELACMSGRPWLTLRSNRDPNEAQLEPATLAKLRGDPDELGDNQSFNPTPAPAVNHPASPFDPIPEAVADTQPKTTRYTVTFIRGGVEQQKTVTVPAVPRIDTVDTSTETQQPANGQH
jgi:pilus assembly protein CpaB